MQGPRPLAGGVVIGRNEGERLARCLESIAQQISHIVYVDSGSTDGSVDLARERGVPVVELDPASPFTAARARNEGLEALLGLHPDVDVVQFIDGDCELLAGWVQGAVSALWIQPDLVAVCGRRSERNPRQHIWNQLCDLEWDTPVGPALSCGGDAMYRVASLQETGGFRASLIAGEEPELCLRLRALGGAIQRLDLPMTLHDAAMTRLGQWLQRNRRAGYAYAEVSALHRDSPYRIWSRETHRALAWGVGVPLAGLALAGWSGNSLWGPLLIVGLHCLAFLKTAVQNKGRWPFPLVILYAASCTLGKFPEAFGVLEYWKHRPTGGRRIMEYSTSSH